MSAEHSPISTEDLHAFVDGQLDADRHAAVAEHLAAHPDAAAKVAAYQSQNEAIAALFGPAGNEPVPAHLSPFSLAAGIRQERGRFWQMAAAAVLVFAVGIGAGYALRGPSVPVLAPDERLIAAAVDAHQLFVEQKRHPVEVAATEKAHLTSWLSSSLDRRLAMPDLSGVELTLVGGRLLPSGSNAAAQIMYETASGDRVTLYITPRLSDEAEAARFEQIGTLTAYYWATDAITCTVVGNITQAEAVRIGDAVAVALNYDV